eukprot:UC1_evm1s568
MKPDGNGVPTNFSYWRWSITGGRPNGSSIHIMPAPDPRRGRLVNFNVTYCPYSPTWNGSVNPYPPSHDIHGCYRSEMARQRAEPPVLEIGKEYWFGFGFRIPSWRYGINWDTLLDTSGPHFQIHGGDDLSRHPVFEMGVDASACHGAEQRHNISCSRWQVYITGDSRHFPKQAKGHLPPDYPQSRVAFDFGPVVEDAFEDWVYHTKFDANPASSYAEIWRNGRLVLNKTGLLTAYNDTNSPYLKFGVYHAGWKVHQNYTATKAAIHYNAVKIGDASSNFQEVSTIPGAAVS